MNDISLGGIWNDILFFFIEPLHNFDKNKFFESLDALIRTDLHNTFNEIRKMLNITKKKVLIEIAFQIMERDNFTFHENRFQIYALW